MTKFAAVLVVDDDEDIRHAMGDILDSAGYSHLEAANGREALDQLEHVEPGAVVLLDLMMPEMDGLSFLEEAQRLGRLAMLQVVILSASPSLCAGRAIVEGLPIVGKPVPVARLLELVSERARPTIKTAPM